MKKASWDMETVLRHHGTLIIKLWLKAAKRSGLSKAESRAILQEATTGDYLHLIATLQKYSSVSSFERLPSREKYIDQMIEDE